ncbi:MAG: tetratricopeptide repeat protein [Acidobacteriota bacterium]
MNGYARTALISLGLACVSTSPLAYGQAQPAVPSAAKPDNHATAYYNFAMAHLYGELASAYGNRGEYVNKAIDFYKQAMKLDPGASAIGEELAELYIQTGQLERATQQANDLIKADPNNTNAHKIIARIYSRQIGDPDQGKPIDQTMLKSAIGEYQKITEINPKDVESLTMLARLLNVAHDAPGAEKTYKAILAVDPNDDDALTGLASLYADRGDFAGAIAMLKPVVEKDPDPRVVTTLAELYDQNKDYSKAADTWKQALPLTNDNVNVRKRYAASLFAANRGDEALKVFQDLATDDPKNLELQLQVAELLGRKRDFTGAHAALAKAKAINNSTRVQIAEAELLDAEGKTAQAVTVVEGILAETKKATYSDPERAQRIELFDMLGHLQRGAGKTQEAVASFRQIAELNPGAASKVELQVVDTLANGRDYKAARLASDAALKKFPGDRVLMLQHAIILSENGQFDGAIAELRALPDAAKDREIQLQIAQIQEKGKRFADERKTLDADEALSTTDQEKQAIAFLRGAMFEREKNFEAAEQQFRKVLASEPNNQGALNYLGYMVADRNMRLEEAQQMISKALDLDPGNGAYLDSLGWVHFRLNKLDQAAGELQEAIVKAGNDPTVHDHLGEVYFKQGKIREAIQQWEASVAGLKTAAPSEQDPEELAKVSKKLEGAKVRISEKK